MKKIIFIIASLIILDQSIKLLISNFVGDRHIDLISGFLHIHPRLHEVNYPTSRYRLPVGIEFGGIIFVSLIGFLLYRFFHFCRDKYKNVTTLFLICIISGRLCSFIDRIFWSGSLDYICFYRKVSDAQITHIIFDLKDVYLIILVPLTLFLATIILIKFFKLKANNISSKGELKEFIYSVAKWIKSELISIVYWKKS